MTETTPAAPPAAARRSPGAVAIVVTMVALSVLGAIGYRQDSSLEMATVPPGSILVSAVVWTVYGVLLVGVIVLLQRFGRRPAWAVLLALAWGGFAAMDVAGRANTALADIVSNSGGDRDITTWLTAPIVEESLKALGIVLLVMIPMLRRIGPLDGMVIGALVGAGFQVVENFAFTITAVSTHLDNPGEAILTTLFLRGILGVFSHVVFSAFVGAAIGWVVAGGPQGRAGRVVGTVLVTAAMMLLHGWSNWSAVEGMIAAHLVVGVLSFAVLVAVAVRARRAENARLIAWSGTDAAAGMDEQSLAVLAAPAQGRTGRRELRAALADAADAEQRYLAGR